MSGSLCLKDILLCMCDNLIFYINEKVLKLFAAFYMVNGSYISSLFVSSGDKNTINMAGCSFSCFSCIQDSWILHSSKYVII